MHPIAVHRKEALEIMSSNYGNGTEPASKSGLCERKMVGTARFELATSRTPSVRATRLRYVPTESAAEKSRRKTTSRLSPGFKQRQETAKSIAQIEKHFAV